MMQAIETEVAEYNHFAEDMNRTAATKRRLVEIVRSVERLKEIRALDGERPIALVHAVEGAHSLQGHRLARTCVNFKSTTSRVNWKRKMRLSRKFWQTCATCVSWGRLYHSRPFLPECRSPPRVSPIQTTP